MKVFNFLFYSFCLIYLFGMSSCKCIELPTSDNTPPNVTLTVAYEDYNGNSVTTYVNTTDHNAPLTVTIPKTSKFTLIYSTTDDGGIKETLLDWSYTTYLGGGIAQSTTPLLTPTVYSGCPKDYRLKTVDYPATPSIIRRVYSFSAHSKDYRNNQNITPVLTIDHR